MCIHVTCTHTHNTHTHACKHMHNLHVVQTSIHAYIHIHTHIQHSGTSIYSVTNYSQHPDRHGIAIVCLVVFVPFCYWGMVYWGQIVDCCCFAGDATSAKDDIELEEAVKEVKEEEI